MGKNTKIEWATHTFNPWIGCTKVSPACAHCYAEVNTATRTRGVKWGAGQARYRTAAANWKKPLAWNRESLRANDEANPWTDTGNSLVGTPRPRVFCASLSDWLDDEVPIEWLADLLGLIHATPHLDWLLLTKRPGNWRGRMQAARDYLFRYCTSVGGTFFTHDRVDQWLHGKPPENVWMGATVEDQQRADERIPHLLSIPARVRFLSCEPLLGAVDLTMALEDFHGRDPLLNRNPTPVQWVIAGGESGPHARPSHPDWFRLLLDQCVAAGVAFFFKQWGEHGPLFDDRGHSVGFAKIGKKVAGRLLDGREWNDVPGPGGGVNRDAR